MHTTHAATAGTYVASTPGYQAYQALHVGFTIVPIIAGADKFFGFLTNGEQYLAPFVTTMVPAHTFMLVVGDRESAEGAVSVRSRAGGDLGPSPVDEFIGMAAKEVESKGTATVAHVVPERR